MAYCWLFAPRPGASPTGNKGTGVPVENVAPAGDGRCHQLSVRSHEIQFLAVGSRARPLERLQPAARSRLLRFQFARHWRCSNAGCDPSGDNAAANGESLPEFLRGAPPVRLGFEDSRQNLPDRFPFERSMSGEHLIKNTAECPGVRATVGLLSSRLFR